MTINLLRNYFKNSAHIINSLIDEEKKIKLIIKNIKQCIGRKKKIIVAGNGGSSSDADHFVGELVCTYKNRSRKSMPAISLSCNSAIVTAWSNDFSFSTVYERQLSSIGTKGDLLILLSTSGGNKKKNISTNLVMAIDYAKKINSNIFGIIGKQDGYAKKSSNKVIVIPEVDKKLVTPFSEAFQAVVWHCLVSHPKLQINKTKW